VYYSLWQRGAYRAARRLARETPFESGSSHHVREFPAAIFNGKAWTSIGAGPLGGGEANSAAASLELPVPRHNGGFNSFAFESVRPA